MKTLDTIDGYEITIDWSRTHGQFGDWSTFALHKVGNDVFEKSGGIRIDGYELIDFSGHYFLPLPVAKALEKHGIKVSADHFTK